MLSGRKLTGAPRGALPRWRAESLLTGLLACCAGILQHQSARGVFNAHALDNFLLQFQSGEGSRLASPQRPPTDLRHLCPRPPRPRSTRKSTLGMWPPNCATAPQHHAPLSAGEAGPGALRAACPAPRARRLRPPLARSPHRPACMYSMQEGCTAHGEWEGRPGHGE